MNYILKPPTKPGYYWLKHHGAEEIVEVWSDDDDPSGTLWIHHCGDGDGKGMDAVGEGEWAGPIPHPERRKHPPAMLCGTRDAG